MKKLLITGISGLLGNSLAYMFVKKYDITGWYNSCEVFISGVNSYKIDITDKQSVREFLFDYKPDIILHCAALTNIDYCQKNKEEAKKVNVEGTQNIVSACRNQDTKLVYISTDAVYDGKKGNYAEDDPVAPCNCYGVTKYEGEESAREHKNHIIVRTNIFGWNIQDKYSLAEWILYNLQKGCSINGFNDAIFSSIYTMEFARIMDMMLEKDLMGTFNLASSRPLSKYEFAILIAKTFHENKALIKPISMDDYPFFARRGENLSLNIKKLEKSLSILIPTIEASVKLFYNDYNEGILQKLKSAKNLPKKYSIKACNSKTGN